MSRDQKFKMKKLANWWRIYFVSINKLVFLKEDNIPNFVRLE